MDAFEQVIAQILERKGYWTRTSVRVELTSKDKKAIERPSSPRWELDIVAYKGATNELQVVECKSYLDSYGVHASAFDGTDTKAAKRYKLFTEPVLRRVLIAQLKKQLVKQGFCATNPSVKLCLAAGTIHGDESRLRNIFAENDWQLWTPELLHEELKALGKSGYENTVAAVVTKLLLRAKAD